MLKNLSKELSIYLLIMVTAMTGFALVALSNSTVALATSHDEETAYCWDTHELGDSFLGEFGESFICTITLANFQPFLNQHLPPIDETYDTRAGYIQRLHDDMIAACYERRAGSSLSRCTSGGVYAGYLYNHLPINADGYFLNGQESELLILLWSEIRINEWGTQSLWEPDSHPPARGSYYVYRPTVEPQPPQADREPPQKSLATPPASLPPESSFEDTHEDNQQGWDDTEDDQYRYDGDGYYRRKKQADGTFKCYFNGYDGSLANLGEC